MDAVYKDRVADSPRRGNPASWIGAGLVFLSLLGLAQAQETLPPFGGSSTSPRVATVTFTYSKWDAHPPYYSITVSSMGNTTYRAQADSEQSTGDPYLLEFVASQATRSRIFDLAARARFFRRSFGLSAATPTASASMTLQFAEGSDVHSISFASSSNPTIQALVTLFQRMAATVQLGRRVARLRASNPAELGPALKRAVQTDGGVLTEFRAIAPTVRQLAGDTQLSDLTRTYARDLLQANPR